MPRLEKKYGEDGGNRIIDFFSTWHHNYQRAAFIDTGSDNAATFEKEAKEMAREHNWKYERIQGNLSLMTKLVTQKHSDSEILFVPPGHFTIYSPFKNGLDSAPSIGSGIPENSGTRHILYGDETGGENKLFIRYGLGIDAGGTYTDAVVYDFQDKKIICKNKALTTKWDFSEGIDNALSGLAAKLDYVPSLSIIELVSVSTTLATNSIVEGEGQKTGLIIMNGNGMVPKGLISHSPRYNIKGYINISGKEIEPVDEDEIRTVVRQMTKRDGVTAFAVSGFAGSINPAHELAVKKIVEEETGMTACCGHELSDLLNFAVRAQTAVLNARIIPRMIKFFRELGEVLDKRGIKAPLMVVKGDGTLMSDSMASKRPVETTLSGPAASVAGAKMLTGLGDAMVVDIGGTTTDIADICDDTVEVCESGANVGGFKTHVKALDMRTSGLGGDSLIRWKPAEGGFVTGPRRVAPLSWAGEMFKNSINIPLSYMAQHSMLHLEQVIYVAMSKNSSFADKNSSFENKNSSFDNNNSSFDNNKSQCEKNIFPFEPTEDEKRIHDLLLVRPHTPEELAANLKCLSTIFLPIKRLEESGLVQRCGLTPTDLLHVRGDFTIWNPEPARRMIDIMSICTKKEPSDIIENLMADIHNNLALELLKKQLFKDIPEDDFQKSPVAQHLLRKIVQPEKKYEKKADAKLGAGRFKNEQQTSMSGLNTKERYRLGATFSCPVIGIGAPVQHFLPKAGKLLNAEVVIPPDADVANAIGAITSHIMIKQKVIIRPDSVGNFVVEGVAGNQSFSEISDAESWCLNYLGQSVRTQAAKAGTSRQTVNMEINDRVVDTGNGLSLFLERSITASLTGSPDLAIAGLN
ncbi:putative hydantoinase/oxoprolinase fusion protein (Hydantoin converting enzyme) [Desulfamplus magnetovallimortis]|uniref:Putative hydantoinase/oxoprolinase fusion protein (Hydantoin converting enzyme) n=1 Tax=Desulfamplus magnetovallimortis TaxID=1246637 RepID=A0A1W1H5U6_9BACT|nr:hydantoinase/oxoprolinase N-terminal domain-containing protein [Desulfamplus magnetovallimortis]SLM27814.1 putative hydantoinase/oxoprolinase fusion protein (Hydantoin converting enzyme) [Desulfamplus magnetovallimortis]